MIGPDEYHEGVDDNAFTNGMAIWNLERGLEVAALLRERWPERWTDLRGQLDLTPDELARWRDVADRLATGVDAASGLIEQFAGFFGLEPIDLARLRAAAGADGRGARAGAHAALPGDQAGGRGDAPRAAAGIAIPPRCGARTSATTSRAAGMAARLARRCTRWSRRGWAISSWPQRYFQQAAAIDLDNTMGNAAPACISPRSAGCGRRRCSASRVSALAADGLRLDPRLPDRWHALRFAVANGTGATSASSSPGALPQRSPRHYPRTGRLTHGTSRYPGTPARARTAWTCRREGADAQWQEESR